MMAVNQKFEKRYVPWFFIVGMTSTYSNIAQLDARQALKLKLKRSIAEDRALTLYPSNSQFFVVICYPRGK
jgi:hypothetical protein